MNRIGFTCSSFDLFHAGHVSMLREAKSQCDYLIVGLQTDPTIDRPEKNKPIQSITERYIQLSGCKYVDEIVMYATENDLTNVLKTFSIDVRILGEEYRHRPFTGKDIEMEFYFNTRQHSFSTTELRERIANAEVLSASLRRK